MVEWTEAAGKFSGIILGAPASCSTGSLDAEGGMPACWPRGRQSERRFSARL